MTKAAKTLKYILTLFFKKDYRALEELTNGVRLSKEDIEMAINDYDAIIIMPPSSVYENLDIIEIQNSNPKAWSVRFDLWTEEEGESDLSLELTFIESNHELYNIEIDNIHVM